MLVFSCFPVHKFRSKDDNMEKINRNDDSLLNETEGAYLNSIFENTRKDFNFINKKVGFIMISGENGKNHYFNMHEKHSINENYPCDNGTLYILDITQKAESGGYDAAIVYWSKFVIPIEEVVKKLKNKS